MASSNTAMNNTKKHQSISRSLAVIYASASARMLIPFIILPIMASRLGADEFGRLSFILIWSGLLSLVVEGGFVTSANRLAVTSNSQERWLLARRVFSARCVLSCLIAPLVYIAILFNSKSVHSDLNFDYAFIFIIACIMGWPAIWYLEATQQLKNWAKLEAIAYSIFVLMCLFFAKNIENYLLFYALATFILTLLSWLWLYNDLKEVRKINPEKSQIWSPTEIAIGLKLAWTMLPINIAGAIYSFALPALAAGHLSRSELGVYFMADRIVRLILSSATPIFSITFPRAVELHNKKASSAFNYSARWAIGGALTGFMILISGIIIWPFIEALIMKFLTGINLEYLRSTLLVLGVLLPLLLCWRFFINWMLSTKELDMAYRISVFSGALVGLIGVHNMGGAPTSENLAWIALRAEISVIIVATTAILIIKIIKINSKQN